MPEANLDLLINEINADMGELIDQSEGYQAFRKDINKSDSDNAYSLSRTSVQRTVDLEWVERIEETIIPLDNIIRNPNRFIKDEEEIIPIEMSRKIGVESVKHLATHTNFIQSVEGDRVTPNKILNVYKEESFATYENRFIKTLLIHLEAFIEKRFVGLSSQRDLKNIESSYVVENFSIGEENVKFKMEISVSEPSINSGDLKDAPVVGTESQTSLHKVQRLRQIVREFMSSPFMTQQVKDAPLVKPPILKTNLLTKHQDYKRALELWQFIESYTQQGYDVSTNEQKSIISRGYIEKMKQLSYLQYLYLKKFSGGSVDKSLDEALERQYNPSMTELVFKGDDVAGSGAGGVGSGGAGRGQYYDEYGDDMDSSSYRKRHKGVGIGDEVGDRKGPMGIKTRNIIRKAFSKILGHYSDDLDEVKNIFALELEKHNRAVEKEEKRIKAALERIIKKQIALDIKERQAEKIRLKKEKEREEARLKKEKERQELERIKAEERAKREEERRLAREQKEKEAQEKAEARAKRQAEREALLQAKEEARKLREALHVEENKEVEAQKEAPVQEPQEETPAEEVVEPKAEPKKKKPNLSKFDLAKVAIDKAILRSKTASEEEIEKAKFTIDTLENLDNDTETESSETE